MDTNIPHIPPPKDDLNRSISSLRGSERGHRRARSIKLTPEQAMIIYPEEDDAPSTIKISILERDIQSPDISEATQRLYAELLLQYGNDTQKALAQKVLNSADVE